MPITDENPSSSARTSATDVITVRGQWTNAGLLLIDPFGLNYSSFEQNNAFFKQQNQIWKCRLQNVSQIVLAWVNFELTQYWTLSNELQQRNNDSDLWTQAVRSQDL